jgi:hypothetical protein
MYETLIVNSIANFELTSTLPLSPSRVMTAIGSYQSLGLYQSHGAGSVEPAESAAVAEAQAPDKPQPRLPWLRLSSISIEDHLRDHAVREQLAPRAQTSPEVVNAVADSNEVRESTDKAEGTGLAAPTEPKSAVAPLSTARVAARDPAHHAGDQGGSQRDHEPAQHRSPYARNPAGPSAHSFFA